jgi:Ser/Thr protein kinase RdoA (MazF antagonist)
MLHAVGRTLAQLHAQAEQWTPPAGWHRPRFAGVWLDMPNPIPQLPEDVQGLFDEAADRVEPILEAALGAPNIVIHADVHQGNYRFAPGHDVGVFDFDDCCWGTPVQDVAITIYYLQRHPRFESLWAALQAGYSTLRPWPGERSTIEGLLIWRTLHLCADVLVHPSPEMRARLKEMIPKWTERLRRFMG